MDKRRLTRSRDQWLAGVCGGIADFLGWKPNVVRTLWILATIVSIGIGGVIAYAIMAFVMPPPTDG